MNTTETKHTPTPWHIFRDAGKLQITGKDPVEIALVTAYKNHERSEANAAFIVRACNEHAALCAVADAAQKMYESGLASDQELFEQAIANLVAVRNPKPKLTEAEHNAFPKGRW